MLMGFASEIHAQSRLTPASALTAKYEIKYRYYINKLLHQNDADFYYFAFEIRPSSHGESFCFYNIQKEEVVYRIAQRSIYYTNSNMINNNDSDKKKNKDWYVTGDELIELGIANKIIENFDDIKL